MNKYYKPTLIWCFCFAILLGSAYNVFLTFDFKNNPDCKTYISIANGKFENQSLVRRYRILVPFAAKAIALPIEKVYSKLWPNRISNDDGPIRLGFLLVNLVLMSFVGLLIFYLGKAYQLSNIVSLIITIATLTAGRWPSIITGAPLTDSLYLLMITCTLYAVKTENNKLLIVVAILGLLSKEAYLMLIPYLFIYARYNKFKLAFFVLIGFGLVWLTRHYIDLTASNVSMIESVKTDAAHFENIKDSILRIVNPRGIGELFTVFGFFSFIYLIGLFGGKEKIHLWFKEVDLKILILLLIALAHALLSTEVGRMLYLFAAPFAIIMGLILQKHPFFKFLQNT
jgi:hypothetical protein